MTLYEPQIFRIMEDDRTSILVFDPADVFSKVLQEGKLRGIRELKYLKEETHPITVINDMYIFDVNSLDIVHKKLKHVLNTDRNMFIYSSSFNIDIHYHDILNPELLKSLIKVKHIPGATMIGLRVPNVYNCQLFTVSLKTSLIHTSLHRSVVKDDPSLWVYETKYLERAKHNTVLRYTKYVDSDVYVGMDVSYISSKSLIDIYTNTSTDTADYIIFKKSGVYFYNTRDTRIDITQYDRDLETYDLDSESIIIGYKDWKLSNTKIIYSENNVSDIIKYMTTNDVRPTHAFTLNPVRYLIQDNMYLNVGRINTEMIENNYFFTKTRSYNIYESKYNSMRLLVSKNSITMTNYRLDNIEPSFIHHILTYFTYASLADDETTIESRLPIIKNVYWSKICQNSGTEIRKPIEYRNTLPDYTEVNDSYGRYWTNKKGGNQNIMIKVDTKYFRCEDKKYPHIGFLKKLKESFGICRPCCFMKSSMSNDLFKQCTTDTRVTIEEQGITNPYILNDRLYVPPGKISYLSPSLDVYMNETFSKNTIRIVSNRLVSSNGYYLVGSTNHTEEDIKNAIINNVLVLNPDGTVLIENVNRHDKRLYVKTVRKGLYYDIVLVRKSADTDEMIDIMKNDDRLRLINLLFKDQFGLFSINADLICILEKREPLEHIQIVKSKKYRSTQLPRNNLIIEIPMDWKRSRNIPKKTELIKFFSSIEEFDPKDASLHAYGLCYTYFIAVFNEIQPFDNITNFVYDAVNLFHLTKKILPIPELGSILKKLNQWYNTHIKTELYNKPETISFNNININTSTRRFILP